MRREIATPNWVVKGGKWKLANAQCSIRRLKSAKGEASALVGRASPGAAQACTPADLLIAARVDARPVRRCSFGRQFCRALALVTGPVASNRNALDDRLP